MILRSTVTVLALLSALHTIPAASADQTRGALPSSMVHTGVGDLRLAPGTMLAWHEPSMVLIEDERFSKQPVSGVLIDEVARTLGAKGFQLVDDPGGATYLLGIFLGMASAVDDMTILTRFGALPGLAAGADTEKARFEKGTIVFTLINPITLELEWKVVLQGVADFEASPPERRARVRHLVERMLAPLPSS